MRNKIWITFLMLLILLNVGSACSTFCFRAGDRILFGKNYDWDFEDGLLMVNKRGAVHVSSILPVKDTIPARWISKFGNVTFNQYGRHNPSGGMNEAGLVVELMWADGSRYPKGDGRPGVDCLEWIQYQLDTASTVADVIASDNKIRIESRTPLHYLIADAQGNAAVIEFIQGKLTAYTGKNLPVSALTNSLYSESLDFLEKRKYWTPTDGGSLARFVRAAIHARNYEAGDPVNYAFKALADVQSTITQWSIVYEIDARKIHFHTKSNPQNNTLSLKDLDFSCFSPVLVFDLKKEVDGDIQEQLREYTTDENLKLIRNSFRQTDFLAETPQMEIERLATLPEQSSCRN